MRALGLLALAAVAVAGTVAPGAASGEANSALPARIQRLEDVEAIGRVLTDYGRLVDARDWNAFADLFAEDGGTWSGGFGTAVGRTAIYDMMMKAMGPTPGPNYHVMSNFEIDVKGDTATAWSRWTFVSGNADGKPAILYGGRYQDMLVRENGRWKFKRRDVVSDVAGPPPQR